jgi:hypothetical protein
MIISENENAKLHWVSSNRYSYSLRSGQRKS